MRMLLAEDEPRVDRDVGENSSSARAMLSTGRGYGKDAWFHGDTPGL